MILCFSGTGNSRYAARILSEVIGDPVLDLNGRMKNGDASPIEAERLILAVPTYAWRIPHVVESYLGTVKLPKNCPIWYVMTCGGSIGAADAHNEKLSRTLGLCHMGTARIIMPENYIAMFDAPDAEETRTIVEHALPMIRMYGDVILRGQPFPSPAAAPAEKLQSGIVNRCFYAAAVRDKAFRSTEKCISCGKCAERCPLNNITLENGRPVWHGKCTHCMACICHCPTEAIEYGKASVGKPRYHLD